MTERETEMIAYWLEGQRWEKWIEQTEIVELRCVNRMTDKQKLNKITRKRNDWISDKKDRNEWNELKRQTCEK